MRNKKLLLSIFVSIILVMNFNVYANEAIIGISLEVPDEVVVNEMFSVDIVLGKSTIAGGECSIVYDDTLLKIENIKASPELSDAGTFVVENPEYEKNEGYITFSKMNNFEFEGTVATATFTPIKEGNTELKIGMCSFSDEMLNEITMEPKSKIINIVASGSNPTEPTTQTTTEITTEITTESTTQEASTESTTNTPVDGVKGDVDQNGTVDAGDAAQIMLYVADKVTNALTDTQAAIADVDASGAIDSGDAAMIMLNVADKTNNPLR